MSLQKYKDHFLLLLEGGFIAVNQMDEDAAFKLFKASELLAPDNVMPLIGKGYLHLQKLELKQAANAFEEALKKDPNNEMAKAFLGISLGLNPKETVRAEKILEETERKTHDGSIKKLCHSAMGVITEYIKKKPSPHDVAKKKHKGKE